LEQTSVLRIAGSASSWQAPGARVLLANLLTRVDAAQRRSSGVESRLQSSDGLVSVCLSVAGVVYSITGPTPAISTTADLSLRNINLHSALSFARSIALSPSVAAAQQPSRDEICLRRVQTPPCCPSPSPPPSPSPFSRAFTATSTIIPLLPHDFFTARQVLRPSHSHSLHHRPCGNFPCNP
jgi:hypothetical protein